MIPAECKRLAEVDFPIAVVSKHAVREKSIRHGHPSTLHLWWARRPLASCRAMLLALLLPDPCDPHCPAEFKTSARALLPKVQGRPGPKDEDLRRALLKFIGDFANWDHAAKPVWLEVARGLVRAAHPDQVPLVVDPFAGGGSIPLEALRLGCEAFASDLNPVACLILKVMLEDIPRHGPKLAEEVRRVGKEIKDAAGRELAAFWPADPDGARPIAYLWARTVRCETPACGAEIPLVRSFWLCRKPNRRRALKPRVERPQGGSPRVEFDVYEPSTEREVPAGTVSRAKATCLACRTVLAPARVRVQLTAQRGGADVVLDAAGQRTGGARLLAVVTLKPGEPGRHYRLSTGRDYQAVRDAAERLTEAEAASTSEMEQTLLPDELIPRTELRRISVPLYGVQRFRDLFNRRQLLALAALYTRVHELPSCGAVNRLLALCIGKTADLNNSNTRWKPDAECPVQTLARHDIPAAWDYAEAAPLSEASGSFTSAYERTADAISATYFGEALPAIVEAEDACSPSLPYESAFVWFTDPPYYDAVPYAHLSDFFYVWEKRALSLTDPRTLPPLTPKAEECVVDRPHSAIPEAKTRTTFEQRMGLAMRQGARLTRSDGLGCVVFAHKTTEGWEALLSAIIRGGWVVTGSWPVITEMQTRLNARENASLAASVHLVCRRRREDAAVGDWAEVLRELPPRVSEWMDRLQEEGIRGADLVFACIGPALEVFSRYGKVETAEGREVGLAEFLEKVWEVVGRAALAQILGGAESGTGALEEDARLTALFLWTLQSTNGEAGGTGPEQEADAAEDEGDAEDEGKQQPQKGYTLIFDVVRRFAQPLGILLPGWEGRIIETRKGVVRLLPVSERAAQLFGQDGAQAVADRLERAPSVSPQLTLFSGSERPSQPAEGRRRTRPARGEVADASLQARREATTLDRVHVAMLLQAAGRANALRALLRAEQERGPDFARLANALSALYPKASEEKRLLDAMLLAVPR